MIDIHSHILPGVDDGAGDLDIAIDMARQYVALGIEELIATPHYIKSGEMKRSYGDNRKSLEEFRKLLDEREIPLKVYLGNQIYMDLDILELLKSGEITSLNQSRYLLIELPIYHIPDYAEKLIGDLVRAGYVPILSHPEKNTRVLEDPNLLVDFIELGALVQVDIPSLQGKFGLDTRDLARLILDHKMVHFLASDSHSNISRSPSNNARWDFLGDFLAGEEINLLIRENPKKIIEDKKIEVVGPRRYKKTRGIVDFLKNI